MAGVFCLWGSLPTCCKSAPTTPVAYNSCMIDPVTFDPNTYALEPWWFLRPGSIHGLSHTRRVLIHAAALAEPAGLTSTESEALIYAVAWHDLGRTHDGIDPEHGRASVDRIMDLNLADGLSPDVLAPTLFAVEWHSRHDRLAVEAAAERLGPATCSGSTATAVDDDLDPCLRVLWTLKDADGLDRVRIQDLDVTRLRSEAARAREAEAWRLYQEMV